MWGADGGGGLCGGACGIGILIFGLVGACGDGPFHGLGACEKHNNFAGFPTWGAVFVGFSRGWGSGCVFSRAFRGSFTFLLVSRGVSQVLDHIVLYSFPWSGLGSVAGVNYQLSIINTIFYFIK